MTAKQRRAHIVGLLKEAVALGERMNTLGDKSPYRQVNKCHLAYDLICCQLGMWAGDILAVYAPKKRRVARKEQKA